MSLLGNDFQIQPLDSIAVRARRLNSLDSDSLCRLLFMLIMSCRFVKQLCVKSPKTAFFYSVCQPLKVTSDAGLLTFRDRFDILMDIRLSGVAKRLWEMSGDNAFLFLNDPALAVELPEDISAVDAGKLIQQLISN